MNSLAYSQIDFFFKGYSFVGRVSKYLSIQVSSLRKFKFLSLFE